MSDMLQLVAKIMDTQVMILPERRTLNFVTLDDKLKHVGHLVVEFESQIKGVYPNVQDVSHVSSSDIDLFARRY